MTTNLIDVKTIFLEVRILVTVIKEIDSEINELRFFNWKE